MSPLPSVYFSQLPDLPHLVWSGGSQASSTNLELETKLPRNSWTRTDSPLLQNYECGACVFLEMNKSNFCRQKSYLTIFVDHLGTIFWDHVLTTMGPLGAHLLSDCIFILHLPPISCSIVRMCRRRAVSCVLLMVPSTPCHPSLVGFYWEPRACRLCSRLI